MTREQTNIPNTEFTTALGNFDKQRSTIDRVVIHSTVGTVQSAINRFGQVGTQVSAHYIVGNDGSLWQGLEEYWTAYHSGNLDMNRRSIGIENEWYQGIHPSDALYEKVSALVKDICTFYNLPINSTTVIPHKQVVPTGCPNEIDVAKIIQMAQGTVDPCASITAERDRLNGVITGKDKEINICNSSLGSITAEKNSLAVQLDACQRDKVTYKEAYDALPALKDQVSELERQKTVWIDKEIQLGKEYKALQTRYLNLKKPGLKFIQDAIIRLCDKMGVDLT